MCFDKFERKHKDNNKYLTNLFENKTLNCILFNNFSKDKNKKRCILQKKYTESKNKLDNILNICDYK